MAACVPMNFRSRFGQLGLLLGCLSFSQGCGPTAPPPAATSPEAAAIVAQKAVAGVGKQGQKLREHSDVAKIISGPAATLINVKQKAILEIQIPHALQLFQATEGRMPKSHDEFMEKIVQFNQLTLPELPEGAVYHFNTELGELWVYPENEVPQ